VSGAIEACGLAVGYDDRVVVSGVDLKLEPGTVLALLGPNGSGKSTILKTLAGLVPKICGAVLLGGEDLDAMSPRQVAQRISFVPQEEAWSFDFSVEEIVAMGRLALSHGFFDTEEDRQAADEAMKEAGCFDLKGRAVTQLSGGERQRVLLARAIAQTAPIVFLDEPTAHLDPQYQATTATLVRHLAKQGKTVLVAVHDLAMAGLMTDLAILVSGGTATPARRTREILESEELDAAYNTAFDRVTTDEGRLIIVPRPQLRR
jgi:iron complex transport system ATP-binding protein